MNADKMNADLKTLLQRIDEIAKIPYDSKKGECRNNIVKYNELREMFLKKCLYAFHSGMEFRDTAP